MARCGAEFFVVIAFSLFSSSSELNLVSKFKLRKSLPNCTDPDIIMSRACLFSDSVFTTIYTYVCARKKFKKMTFEYEVPGIFMLINGVAKNLDKLEFSSDSLAAAVDDTSRSVYMFPVLYDLYTTYDVSIKSDPSDKDSYLYTKFGVLNFTAPLTTLFLSLKAVAIKRFGYCDLILKDFFMVSLNNFTETFTLRPKEDSDMEEMKLLYEKHKTTVVELGRKQFLKDLKLVENSYIKLIKESLKFFEYRVPELKSDDIPPPGGYKF